MNTPITFNISIGTKKPHSGKQDHCPFCDTEHLTNILEKKADMIWLMNKFPVFEGTWPTVLIETAEHDSDLSKYSPEKLHQVIEFGMTHWLDLEKKGCFKSVIYFRNFGPGSGGSQRHPHSQIVGLNTYDYRDNLTDENFLGTIFHEDADCFCSTSSYPISGMGEFNVTLKKDGCVKGFANALQKIAQFILKDFPLPCSSYNIFFYHLNKHIHAKVFPRYAASPLYMGYRITHVMDEANRSRMIEKLRSPTYFGDV